MIQAEYLNVRFEISEKVKSTLSKIELARDLKIEEKETKDGTNQLKIMGYEAQSFPIEYQASPAFGLSAIDEYEKWVQKLGKRGVFILGNHQFGIGEFELHSVSLSNVLLSNSGRVELASISLTLKQDEVLTAAALAEKYEKKRKEKVETVSATGGTEAIE